LRKDTVEDSANGIGAAHTAGVRVITIPNRRYRPPADALVLADVVLGSVSGLTPETVAAV
jgi:beta-phosphoglucomutase-like phosphatase (HAD superfamily)